jgi:SNF2 family DNA or RNA helicase
LNDESTQLVKAIPGAMEVAGRHSTEYKEDAIADFVAGNVECMVSKPSIFGAGLNLQVCSDTLFCGLSDSFEMLYQATKRFHRYGQKKEVHRHLIYSEAEGNVRENLLRKENEFNNLIAEMVKLTQGMNMDNVKQMDPEKNIYVSQELKFPKWLQEGGY